MKLQKFIFIFLVFSISFYGESRSFESTKIAVSGPSLYLKKPAQRIYEKGGNVVDIAVASALTLSVTVPFYVSLGSGGFALIDMEEKITALDFREMAPQKMHPDYYKEKSSTIGGSAVGVPGFVAGLWEIHQKYGKLKWKTLFKDAIDLAQNGYLVSGEWAQITRNISERQYGMNIFFNGDQPFKPGEKIVQQNLAQALKIIRRKNIKGFYEGKIAQDIVDSVNQYGGDMALSDLQNYQPKWRTPIHKKFNSYDVYIMPPPSSGGIVISSALDLIQQKQLNQFKPLSVSELHFFSEIMSRAFRGRSLIADPDYFKIPFNKILSPIYLQEMGKSISAQKTQNLQPLKETTHLIVMDHEGNSVSMTLTLNLSYGSKAVSSRYGIVLNNQMDDFTTRINQANSFGLIQGQGNKVEAQKRPLSSMSPTLVQKNGKTVLALGGSGGPRIITGVLQSFYRTLVNGFDIDSAIQYPRIHHQFLPQKTYVEKNRFSEEVLLQLSKKGHSIEETSFVGKVYGIFRDEENILKSAYDHRGDGLSWGL